MSSETDKAAHEFIEALADFLQASEPSPRLRSRLTEARANAEKLLTTEQYNEALDKAKRIAEWNRVPMDGRFVLLEDDATGAREVARWSTEAGGWVGEDGAPSKITPTYWHPFSQEDHGSGLSPAGWSPSEKAQAEIKRILIKSAEAALVEANRGASARLRLAVSSMAAILVGVALLGFLFRVELAAYVTRHAHVSISRNAIEQIVKSGTTPPSQESQSAESSVHDQELVHQLLESPLDRAQTHAQVAQTAEGEREGEKTASLGRDVAEARQELKANSVQDRHELAEERKRTAALTRELAKARGEIEAHAALSNKADAEAAQVKQAAENATADLRQSLQEERDRAEALTRELAKARGEIEAHAALSNKADAEAAQVKQVAESATADLRQSLQEERDRTEALTRELAKARGEIEAHAALSSKADAEAAQVKQVAENATADLRQSLQEERDRTEALTRELAKARGEIEAHAALSSKADAEAAQVKQAAEKATADLRQSLQEERDRAEALTRELAKARGEIEAHAPLSNKADAEVAQVKQAAESATADLRQSLQEERDRTEALTRELAKARGEIEAHAALSSKADAEAAQVKQAAEKATADLRHSLQEERDRAEALARKLESARRTIEARIAFEREANSQATQEKQAAEAAAAEFKRSLEQERARSRTLEMRLAAQKENGTVSNAIGTASTNELDISSSPATQEKGDQGAASERPAATAMQGSPEAAWLLARASALLGEGNVGAARIVLERAAEIGSIQATFTLAETYDPDVLLAWRTYGTRGDATKARELYAKAYAAGIQEAKDRLNALRP